MNLYETTFIINPQSDDATIDRHVREIADLITKNQGKIALADHMGTRRLAYPINGLTQGYYASFIFEGPTGILPLMERHFRLNEAYIRDLTVRFEGNLEQMLEEQRGGPRPAEVALVTERVERPADHPRPAPIEPAEAVVEEPAEAVNEGEADETGSDEDDEREL